MKILYSLTLMCILLTGCGIIAENSGHVKMMSNGLTATKNYLMVDMVQSDKTEFAIGSDLNYILEGVTGYSLRDDWALFGCSMTVIDQADKKPVLHYDDLFADREAGYSKEDASLLTLKLSIDNPMTVDHSYSWNLRVWDKRGKGELTVEMIFKVVKGKDLVGIKTESKGLNPSDVYILSNGLLESIDVKVGQKLTLVFKDIDGYAIQADSLVSIGASMVVLDKDSVAMLVYSDLFQNYKPMTLDQAKTTSVYITIGDPMKPNQTYLWKVRAWDKSNQQSVESSISFHVVE